MPSLDSANQFTKQLLLHVPQHRPLAPVQNGAENPIRVSPFLRPYVYTLSPCKRQDWSYTLSEGKT